MNYQALSQFQMQYHDDLLWCKEFRDTKRGHCWVLTDLNLPGKREDRKMKPSLLNPDLTFQLRGSAPLLVFLCGPPAPALPAAYK